jgi:hypothetical protein
MTVPPLGSNFTYCSDAETVPIASTVSVKLHPPCHLADSMRQPEHLSEYQTQSTIYQESY